MKVSGDIIRYEFIGTEGKSPKALMQTMLAATAKSLAKQKTLSLSYRKDKRRA